MSAEQAAQIPSLVELGWKPFFSSQLSVEDVDRHVPVRVMAAHRGQLEVVGAGIEMQVPSYGADVESEEDHATVGDWLLLDRATMRPGRVLRRTSLFKRRAPGAGRGLQLLAANVDTLLIVSSCNQDFNIARLERYLVLAREAGVTPVVVLTKADLVSDPDDYARVARRIQPQLVVEAVNALDPDTVARIGLWCGTGQTMALMGSSGVGKSTLVNTLTGSTAVPTQGVREDDDKGRHTTTSRSLHRLAQGGWLLDTPGMRELRLADAASGLRDVFDDIVALARDCRFSDCAHQSEPGCAVTSAIANGALDEERFRRWRKLADEEAHNTSTLAERRTRARAFGKRVRAATKAREGRRWQ